MRVAAVGQVLLALGVVLGAGAVPVAAQAAKPARRPAARASKSPALSLAKGTLLVASATSALSSRQAKVGDSLTATIDADVKDARGRTVIPAGATVHLLVDAVRDVENTEEKSVTHVMTFRAAGLTVAEKAWPLPAKVDTVMAEVKARGGIVGGDQARAVASSALEVLAQKVIAKDSSKAALVQAGTEKAKEYVEKKDADTEVAAGAKVKLILTASFSR